MGGVTGVTILSLDRRGSNGKKAGEPCGCSQTNSSTQGRDQIVEVSQCWRERDAVQRGICTCWGWKRTEHAHHQGTAASTASTARHEGVPVQPTSGDAQHGQAHRDSLPTRQESSRVRSDTSTSLSDTTNRRGAHARYALHAAWRSVVKEDADGETVLFGTAGVLHQARAQQRFGAAEEAARCAARRRSWPAGVRGTRDDREHEAIRSGGTPRLRRA